MPSGFQLKGFNFNVKEALLFQRQQNCAKFLLQYLETIIF